jgi:MoxR-like ATPase
MSDNVAAEADVEAVADLADRVVENVEQVIVGHHSAVEHLLTAILGRGHVLVEDVPGVGKTMLARALAQSFHGEFRRVQFTPDLLPADITGTNVYNQKTQEFEFRSGPIFANVVLGDEINRAPPKTQSALLEAMEERQVTADGETRDLPSPCFGIATQNPVEYEGTFPLPEAQIDRFIAKTSIGYPDAEGETELLHRRAGRQTRSPTVERVLDPGRVVELREVPESVRVDDDLIEYVTAIARATREDRRVEVGVSPRGTQRLFEAARAQAVLGGREFVTPDDVKTVVRPVLAHRIVLTPDAKVEDVEKGSVVSGVVDSIPVPTI